MLANTPVLVGLTVLTYRLLLLASSLPPTADHPPRIVGEGEKEEGGRGRRKRKKGGEGKGEEMNTKMKPLCSGLAVKLTAWADVTGTSLPGLVTVRIFNVSIATRSYHHS